MKKNIKQIIAIIALVCIAVLIIAFFISALFTSQNTTSNNFSGLFLGIISIPLLAWGMIFCIGTFKNKHTIASLFPENFFKNILDNDGISDTNDSEQ